MESSENQTFNNSLSCLNYNEQLNKLLLEMNSIIERRIESINDTRDNLLSQVKKEDQNKGSYIIQILNGRNSSIIRKPYFITPIGLTPPTIQTVLNKNSSGSYDFYDLKQQLAVIGSSKELNILKEAIGTNVFDIKKQLLITSSEKVIARELNALNTQSFAQLTSKCDSYMIDRIDWLGISTQNLKGRISAENCRKICSQLFNPDFAVPKWTDYECQELLRLVSEIGSQGHWVEIASRMPMKILPFRCFKKWLDLTSKMESCQEWDAEEDSYLCEVVSRIKEKDDYNRTVNWNKVALSISNRSARDCEKRWNSLQVKNRHFTDAEDHKLLLLIKRIGTENWVNISKEMELRTIEQCQQRYCEIVEDYYPWTYSEDRKLWLHLRSNFRELWRGNEKMEEFTSDLNLYKSTIKYFKNRCPLIIRRRYYTLCKWFCLWNKFYLCLNSKYQKNSTSDCQTISLLSDISQEQTAIFTKIKNIIFKTSFFVALCRRLKLNGSLDPEADATELIEGRDSKIITKFINDSNDPNLLESLWFFIDFQNGIFIPRQFDKYIHRPENVLKKPETANSDLRCLSANVKNFEIRNAVGISLKKRLSNLSNHPKISSYDKSCIERLLTVEGKFVSSFDYAISFLERTHDFKFMSKACIIEKMLPQFLKLMVQYIYHMDDMELSKKSLTVHFTNNLASKREQIAELLIYRNTIPAIYRTYPPEKKQKCFITENLTNDLYRNLSNHKYITLNSKKIIKILESQQNFPLSDESCYLSDRESMKSLEPNNKVMMPNRATLHLLRALLLQKQNLLEQGEEVFCRMVRLKYDDPVNYLKRGQNSSNKDFMQLDNSTSDLCDPKYECLRSRLMSLLAVPSVVAKISPYATALIADKLHEIQNGVKNSSQISESFNTISEIPESVYRVAGSTLFYGQQAPCKIKLPCKRKALEFLDDYLDSDEEMEYPEHLSNHDKPITRHSNQRWISIFLPDSQRTVFIPKGIFHPVFANNFKLDSINGINVDEITKK